MFKCIGYSIVALLLLVSTMYLASLASMLQGEILASGYAVGKYVTACAYGASLATSALGAMVATGKAIHTILV